MNDSDQSNEEPSARSDTTLTQIIPKNYFKKIIAEGLTLRKSFYLGVILNIISIF